MECGAQLRSFRAQAGGIARAGRRSEDDPAENAVVHYDLARPEAFVLNQADGAATVRATFESVVASIVTQSAMDELLTTGGQQSKVTFASTFRMNWIHHACGVRTLGSAQDVHLFDGRTSVSGRFWSVGK